MIKVAASEEVDSMLVSMLRKFSGLSNYLENDSTTEMIRDNTCSLSALFSFVSISVKSPGISWFSKLTCLAGSLQISDAILASCFNSAIN